MRLLFLASILLISGCLAVDNSVDVQGESETAEATDVAEVEYAAQTSQRTVAGPWNMWLEVAVPEGAREIHVELDFDPYSGLYDIIAYGPDGEQSRCGGPCVTVLHGGSLKLLLDAGQPGDWRFQFAGNGAGVVQGSYSFMGPE